MTDIQMPSMKNADKIVGAVLAIVAGALLIWGGIYVMPLLVELAKNTIVFIAELVVLAFLAIVFLDPNTWRSIYYKWKNISRNIRKAIVREDPLGTLDTVISRFVAKLETIDENLVQADGARKRQDKAIEDCLAKAAEEANLVRAAKNQGKSNNEIGQHAASSKRWEKAALEMRPQQEFLTKMMVRLEQARDLANSKINDLRDQKSVLAIRLESMQDGQQAVRGLKRLFGNNDDLIMQDMALEEIERQSFEAEAEIDQFMKVISPSLAAADLKREAEMAAAMEQFGGYVEAHQLPAGSEPLKLVAPRTDEAKVVNR